MIWGFVSRMARHRHPQDRRTISLAGTSCTSGVVSGRSAASMAQRAICASSKPSDDLSSSLFLRFDFEWSNFATAITDGGILKAIVNSVIITLCSTVITCLVGAAAAYPLARRQTRGNKLVSAGILAIMMIPPLSILVPLYSFLVQIGGVNSYWGIVLVLSTTNLPLAIFLYTAFIRAIPASIDEAGMVDGASKPKIFFTLILPLLKPVTATVVIMTSVGVWNEYALSNYLITDASMQPIAPRVVSFFASNSSNLGVGAAAALMAALPIVVLDLVGRAARLGVERFVLDDGWFHARRTDTAGLGDWWVDRSVWPDGLKPLADAIHDHGMQFGLWFEPEMVNPDSDLYREHPDWVLQATGRLPLPHRNQQVLDLTNPDAFAHVLEQISTVLGECGVDYVKWDHNRDLLEAGTNTRGGAPAVHEQTVAYYRLLDTLRGRFPNIQWESCASGGGRIDLGVIEHIERVWTSDMTDALSRQRIQPWRVAACPRPGPEGALPAAVGGAGGRGPRGRIAGGVPPRLGSSAGVGPVGSGRHHHRRGLGHDRRAHPPLPSRNDPSDRDRAGLIRNNEGPVGGRSSNMTIPRPRGLRLRYPDQPVFWRPAATPDTVHRMR